MSESAKTQTETDNRLRCFTCSKKADSFVYDIYGIQGYRECRACWSWDYKARLICGFLLVVFVMILCLVV